MSSVHVNPDLPARRVSLSHLRLLGLLSPTMVVPLPLGPPNLLPGPQERLRVEADWQPVEVLPDRLENKLARIPPPVHIPLLPLVPRDPHHPSVGRPEASPRPEDGLC